MRFTMPARRWGGLNGPENSQRPILTSIRIYRYIDIICILYIKERMLDYDTCLVLRKSLVQPRVQKELLRKE